MKFRSLAICLLMVIGPGISRNVRAADIKSGGVCDDRSSFQLAVYFLPSPSPGWQEDLRLALRASPGLRLVAKEPAGEIPFGVVRTNLLVLAESSYDPPPAAYLRLYGHGLSPADNEKLRASTHALQLLFTLPEPRGSAAHREVHAFLADFARGVGGIIWDEETREAFAPDAWEARRALPEDEDVVNLLHQTVLNLDEGSDGLLRVVSLGMRKFGLPDIALDNLPRTQARQGARVVNTVALALAAGTPLDEQGRFILRRDIIQPPSARKAVSDVVHTNANAEVVIELRAGRRQSGDPDNRLLEVSLAPYFGSDETARLAALLFAMFGGETDVRAAPDTPEYLAAVQRARARLPEWRKRFLAGLRPGDILCVKKEFKTPGGQVERMWIEVIEWNDDGMITGVLQNEPVQATDFQEGQQLTLSDTDILDVIHIHPDGTFEGNETGLIKQAAPPP
jgi:uncharacterized protein YegJ (DUF2314 family)